MQGEEQSGRDGRGLTRATPWPSWGSAWTEPDGDQMDQDGSAA
jgi:hypothetical protein